VVEPRLDCAGHLDDGQCQALEGTNPARMTARTAWEEAEDGLPRLALMQD